MTQNRPARFFFLDALRGLAALSVVLWHWQHFFWTEKTAGNFHPERQPFFRLLPAVYDHGWMAVHLFFTLSGFIFYWLYAEAVSKRKISARAFATLRFSRLYPLHLATLLLVIAGQAILHRMTSAYLVYGNHDLYHFFLNLFLANGWGLEKGFSFNGPAWSISVEVLLYALFFILCRSLPIRFYLLLAAGLIGFFGVGAFDPLVGKGMGAFFLGGCVQRLYARIAATGNSRHAPVILAPALILPWIGAVLTRNEWYTTYLPLRIRASDLYEAGLILLLFPATVLAFALLETRWGKIGKHLGVLGDISYSSYLLHFPLQLAFFCVTTRFALPHDLYYSPWMMLLFFAVLIPLSLASHRGFEMPVQRLLRGRLLGKRIAARHA